MSEKPDPSNNIPGQPLDAIRCDCGTTVKTAGLPPLSMVQCPNCQTKFPVTVKLGNFLLLSELGSGAMGEVYEAKDRTLGRHVAIKVIGGKATVSDKTIRDFVGEARNLAQLNHRNVVQIHSIGVEDKHPYLVMELVGAGRLDQYIVRDTPGDERTTLTFGIDSARGLEAAANRGLIHGDVKPANILINEEGLAKIVDFGLARFAESEIEGKVYGTPFYIAPELLEGKGADFRSDMYSLGCTLYHVLAGRPPFRSKKVKDIVRARLLAPAPDIRTFSPDVSEYTSYIFTRVLAKNPDERYVDYDEFVQDMTYALQLLDAGGVQPPGPIPPPANANTDSAADLNELDAAVSNNERDALTSRGHSHSQRRRTSARRGGKRTSGRRDSGLASHTHMDGMESDAQSGKKPLALIVIIALIVAASVGLAVVMFSGNPGDTPDDPGTKDRVTHQPVDGFVEKFEGHVLGPQWKKEGDGILLPGGNVLRLTDPGTDPRKDAAVSRLIGTGDYTAEIKAKAIVWAGRGEEIRFEFMHDDYNGLRVVVSNDQGVCRMECEATSPEKSKIGARVKFEEKPPTALSLSVRWSEDTGQWRVSYGINGDPPAEKLEPINRLSAADPGKARKLKMTANQFGSNGVTSMDIDAVAVDHK